MSDREHTCKIVVAGDLLPYSLVHSTKVGVADTRDCIGIPLVGPQGPPKLHIQANKRVNMRGVNTYSLQRLEGAVLQTTLM